MTWTTPPGAPRVPTVFEWAGGTEALSRLTRIFYGHVKTDPILAPVFAEMTPEHPEWVARWLGEVFGGPATYTQQRGGYRHMLSRHLGRALTEQQRARWVRLMGEAADEAGLPTDPEFRSAFVSYMEWGHGSRWRTASQEHNRRRTCRCRTGTGARPARRQASVWARAHRRPLPHKRPQRARRRGRRPIRQVCLYY